MKILTLLALVACVAARTTYNTQPISAHITSLNDKDARQKAMVHPAFANAGTRAGVEIWRIEDFEPIAVPAKDFGKFYKGDSYIILKTTADKKGNLSWDIHYWIGSGSSQDEAGAAAILTVGLDDKFGGAAVQHRETLGYESPQFVGYFKPAIRYLDGGHASGFSHVTPNAGAEKRLFQVKGKRNVRVRQVDPLISSMNKGDVFILDVNQDIYVYVGDRSKNVEKLKAISVANQIRDQDHNGRGRVEIIDKYSSEADKQKFFTALGSGSPDAVPDESAGGDDQAFERNEEQSVTLSEISDSTGSLKITPLPKPYRQEQLKPQECYILDTVGGSIYVWVGKQSTEREKTEAMNKAQQYLTAKNYPSWVHVTRVPQGTEPAAFKQYFTTWRDVGMAHSRIVRSLSDEEFFSETAEVSNKRARTIAKSGAARGFMPDNGAGSFTVYRVENNGLTKAYDANQRSNEPGKRAGQFFQGDSYVVDYQTKDGQHIVYYWLGADSTADEQASAATNAAILDNKLNGKATVVRVPQGEEPKHFLKIFKGRLVTLFGGKSSGFRGLNQKNSYESDGVRLFRVYGTKAGEDIRAEQWPEAMASLQSDDAYLLETPDKVYVWLGKGSIDVEREEAVKFIPHIVGERPHVTVNEGQENHDFWKHLSGDSSQIRTDELWRDRLGKRIGAEPRLYEAILKSNNKVIFEESLDFKQKDLEQDEVNILDLGDEIYVWVGKDVPDQMRKAANLIAQTFLQQREALGSTVVVFTKQGMEPPLFTEMFDKWDPQMWLKQPDYAQQKEEYLMSNDIYKK